MRKLNTNNKTKTEITIFDSVCEQVETVMAHLATKFEGRSAPEVPVTDEYFVGRKFESMDEVVKTNSQEWPEGLAMLSEMMESLSSIEDLPKPKCRSRRIEWSDMDGDEIDIDRLRSGQEFFRTSVREAKLGPQTMTVFIDCTTKGGKNSRSILWRGAAGLAIANILETLGYRVEIWMVEGGRARVSDRRAVQVGAVLLKAPSDPFDMSTMVNALSGWFYRTVWFGSVLKTNEGHDVDSGFGQCHTPTHEELDFISTDEARVYISGVWDAMNAKQVVVDEITKFAAMAS